MVTKRNIRYGFVGPSLVLLAVALASCGGDNPDAGDGNEDADRGRRERPGVDAANGDFGADSGGAAACDGVSCEGDAVCVDGECVDPADCPPSEIMGCQDGLILTCNAAGNGFDTMPCPDGEGCSGAGECEPILPNVLLLVDTSSSMNWTPGGIQRDECSGACWPWSYPSCDDASSGPVTRLGRVKDAMTAILASDAAADLRIALQRFPQSIYTALPPDCEGGYWTGNSTIQGDEGFHAVSRTWLRQRLSEIVIAPFPETGQTDLTELSRWFDGEDRLVETPATCAVNDECDGTPCLNGHCMAFENPEVWGMGLTPFGKSLFYAGEYMRHFVVVEGRPCEATADCGSASYTCVEGACHDPFRACRPNVIIAFTDGAETEHFRTDRYFHPRVQAKRLHYGLGCELASDCSGGALCDDGVCRPPDDVIDGAQLVCDTDDTPCSSDGDCPGRRCRPAALDFVDAGGEDRLFDAAGNPISLIVHVVDASNVPGANTLVAAYGGGQHFSVDLDDPEAVVATFETLFGDAKELISCLYGD